MENLLDLAGSTRAELAVAEQLEPVKTRHAPVFDPFDKSESEHGIKPQVWSMFDGVMVRWGDSRMRRLQFEIATNAGPEHFFNKVIFRIIMPDGSICDGRFMQIPGRAMSWPIAGSRLIAGWSHNPPDLSVEDTEYFFCLPCGVIQVERIALPALATVNQS